MDRLDLAVLEHEDIAAPVDLVVGKTGKPYPEGNQVAQRQQP
jgi:hypothetical protein